MRIWTTLQRTLVTLATAGLLLPASGFAQSPAGNANEHPAASSPIQVKPLDVALQQGGTLSGRVVDSTGRIAPNLTVVLLNGDQLVAAHVTDESGYFAMHNVDGGVYRIVSGDQMIPIRCWAPRTAPPAARDAALIQIGDVERAQVTPAQCSLLNPWIIAGLTITAIAVPIALSANRDDRDNGSG